MLIIRFGKDGHMNKRPYVVAVAGGTCSGKSTLADMLEEMFGKKVKTKVLNMDAYFKKEPPTVIAPITGIEYVEHNHPETLELDRLENDFNEALDGDFALVIIEGLFALHIAALRKKADLKIYVDLESDARLVRRIKKHMAFGQTLTQVTDRYIDTVRFRHNELVEPSRWHADVVINGNLDANKGVEVVAEYIQVNL